MKKFILSIITLTIATWLTSAPALAGSNAGTPGTHPFHNGGTGNCDGCHLVKSSDPSSMCLGCHEAPLNGDMQQHYIATKAAQMTPGAPPGELTPGGDFGWLKKSYKWGNERSPGENHGHNIVALDHGYNAGATVDLSPGGTYPSGNLSCISCHDPHGNYRRLADGSIANEGLPIVASGSYPNSPDPNSSSTVGTYRLLAGKGYTPKALAGSNQFKADPPAAISPVNYNRPESSTDTRVAYGSGMSEWCANCHGSIHNDSIRSARRHPAGNSAKLTGETIMNYNMYIASGNLNGNNGAAYTSMVPFEMGTSDYGVLKATANSDGSVKSGPSTEANVMCLTCHRAHASGWDAMTRWNMQADFIVINGHYPGADNGASEDIAQGRTAAETKKTFYDRPASKYSAYQRSLCNKCHAKD